MSESQKPTQSFSWLFYLWPIVLLSPLVWVPLPTILIGHPWKPELAISFLLLLCLPALFLNRSQDQFAILRSYPIISFSLIVFIIWSASSAIWANSTDSVIHHTLVWSIYLIFFALVLNRLGTEQVVDRMMTVLMIVVTITAGICVIEYVFRERIDQTFGFRYGRYAEIWATLLPLFIYFTVKQSGRMLVWSGLAMSLVGVAITCALSRASLFAALISVIIFSIFAFFSKATPIFKKRLAVCLAVLLFSSASVQLSGILFPNELKTSTLSRLSIDSEVDKTNSLSRNIRLLFATVGLEMFRSNALVGIGADNFGLAYNKYLAEISKDKSNRDLVIGNDTTFPQRTHNEYIQIASELGVIGLVIFSLFLLGILRYGFSGIFATSDTNDYLLKLAAAAGLFAFSLSSTFSSFSFRLIQNGIVFFFLLTLLIKNKKTRRSVTSPHSYATDICVFLVCFSMFAYSLSKGISQFYTYQLEITPSADAALSDFESAKFFDSENISADATLSFRLLKSGDYSEAARLMTNAVNNGAGTSPSYTYLIAMHALAENNSAALSTAQESIKIFPNSVFLQTKYSILLQEAGMHKEAEKHLEIAKEIDKRQAETWVILINNGAEKAAEAGRNGIGVKLLSELRPQDCLYAVIEERNIRFPEERFSFPTLP